MALDGWDEVRTAWAVARHGTVSGAAEALGVHHATVIRHIDALEKRLGTRLFQRHARGYTPTEAGRDLFRVAQEAADQFGQLTARIKGHGETVTGELAVTSIAGLAPLLAPALAAFQAAHPGLTVRLLTDARVFRLEYGEAHLAVRAGTAPEEPDNVVQPFGHLPVALYAGRGYAAAHGLPQGPGDLARHRFVAPEGPPTRAPSHRWLTETVPPAAIAFRATEPAALVAAIRAGAGLGFVAPFEAARCPDLVEALPARADWAAPLWLVTHVDLHRTAKVQAALAHLKDAARLWSAP